MPTVESNPFAIQERESRKGTDRKKEQPDKRADVNMGEMLYAQSRSVKANTGQDARENSPIEEAAAHRGK